MNKRNLGFTLIELLVVIGIIGILAGGLMVILNPGAQMAKARDAIRLSNLNDLRKALEIYYVDKGSYPSDGTSGVDVISINGTTDQLSSALVSSQTLTKVPTDPKFSSGCVYYYGTPGWWDSAYAYALEMRFETQSGAAQAEKAGGNCWNYSGGYNWGSGVCAGYNCYFKSPHN